MYQKTVTSVSHGQLIIETVGIDSVSQHAWLEVTDTRGSLPQVAGIALSPDEINVVIRSLELIRAALR